MLWIVNLCCKVSNNTIHWSLHIFSYWIVNADVTSFSRGHEEHSNANAIEPTTDINLGTTKWRGIKYFRTVNYVLSTHLKCGLEPKYKSNVSLWTRGKTQHAAQRIATRISLNCWDVIMGQLLVLGAWILSVLGMECAPCWNNLPFGHRVEQTTTKQFYMSYTGTPSVP